MDERSYLMKNDKILINSQSWLVLQNDNEYSLIIKLNTSKLHIEKIKTEDIVYKIIRKEATLDISQNTDDKTIEIKSLPLKQQQKYELSKKICEYILSRSESLEWLIHPEDRAYIIETVMKEFNVSANTVRRKLLCFLQGGMKPVALLPKYYNCGSANKRNYTDKKSGKSGCSVLVRDENLEKIFSTMTARFLSAGANIPLTKLYSQMVNEFFSEESSVGTKKPFPVAVRPTQKQLRYWINTHTDKIEREEKRRGKKEIRNNNRPLFSDTIAYLDVETIGARYEMDEMETDFYLVSRINRTHPIGRAIVYFIVDVFSRAIVACGIGLDNNSWSGAELALLNLVENKKEFCSRYGMDIDESKWSMKEALPKSILVDNGAEYLSENMIELAKEAGISIDFAPPRMGSYKPNVEQKFHQMNELLKNNLPGEIDIEKYGQPHIRKASLDICQYSKAVIQFILEYNNNPIDNYPESKDMFENHLLLTPNNIWNYCLQKYNQLTFVNDIETYKYCLLKRDTASITRSGIEYKGRYFISLDLPWLEREASNASIKGHKRKHLDIRLDTRFPDIIYYKKDNRRYTAFLNCPEVRNDIDVEFPVNVKTSNSKYTGLSEPEIEDILKIKKQQKSYNTEVRLENRINSINKINDIKKEASLLHSGANKFHGIENNRNEEKQKLYQEQHIVLGVDKTTNELTSNSSSEFEVKADLSKMTRVEKIRWKQQQKIGNISTE